MSSPPKTDKFAAMAARQQQQQQQQQQLHQHQEPISASDETFVQTSFQAKQDKLAAMTARQHQQQQRHSVVEEATGSTSVNRDNIVSEPSRQDQQEVSPEITPGIVSSNVTSQENVSARRDKFAAVAEQSGLQNQLQSGEEKQKVNNELKRMCSQRDAIWADLDQAEQMVVQLLDIAHDTSKALTESSLQLDDLPQRFQSILQKIHSLLQPHAGHIHAYQQPQAINRMYQTRVEWRLAVEAKNILEEYRRLEAKNKHQFTGSLKRDMDVYDEHQPTKRVKR